GVLLVPGRAGLAGAQRPGGLRDDPAGVVVDDGLRRRRRAVDRDDQLGPAAHTLGETMIFRPRRSLAARNASSAFSSGKVWETTEVTSMIPASVRRIVRGYISFMRRESLIVSPLRRA